MHMIRAGSDWLNLDYLIEAEDLPNGSIEVVMLHGRHRRLNGVAAEAVRECLNALDRAPGTAEGPATLGRVVAVNPPPVPDPAPSPDPHGDRPGAGPTAAPE